MSAKPKTIEILPAQAFFARGPAHGIRSFYAQLPPKSQECVFVVYCYKSLGKNAVLATYIDEAAPWDKAFEGIRENLQRSGFAPETSSKVTFVRPDEKTIYPQYMKREGVKYDIGSHVLVNLATGNVDVFDKRPLGMRMLYPSAEVLAEMKEYPKSFRMRPTLETFYEATRLPFFDLSHDLAEDYRPIDSLWNLTMPRFLEFFAGIKTYTPPRN